MDRESRRFLASPAARKADLKTMVVLITVAVSLSLQWYWGDHKGAPALMSFLETLGLSAWAASLNDWLNHSPDPQLNRLLYWTAGCHVVYFFIPAFVIRVCFRERLSDYGMKLKGAFADSWLYLVLLVVVLPLVYVLSNTASFQAKYPFYRIADGVPLGPSFWIWELAYASQFLTLEFFFRGFIVHGTKQRFGVYSIFVMTVPYCMIHFGKPMPETFAAIIAGVVLGFLSLKNRSIWLGTVSHITVAWAMDIAALWRQGYIP